MVCMDEPYPNPTQPRPYKKRTLTPTIHTDNLPHEPLPECPNLQSHSHHLPPRHPPPLHPPSSPHLHPQRLPRLPLPRTRRHPLDPNRLHPPMSTPALRPARSSHPATDPSNPKPPTPERLSPNDDEASHSRIQTVSNPPRPPPYCQRPSTTAPNHPTRHQDLLRRAVAPAARARARPRLHARALHRDLVLREA